MKILITGGTGFIGKHLISHFIEGGHELSLLGRSKVNLQGVNSLLWNPNTGEIDNDALKKNECIIHLAGASLSEGRWTEKRKKEIIDSRVKSGELIYKQLCKNKGAVKTFISSSGIGIYGNTGDLWADESTEPANDFLAEVCKAWEAAAQKIASLGIRVVILRTGIVLGSDGGALPVLAKPVKLYAGSALGSGKQYLSWIHIDDMCRIYMKACEDEAMQGTYNAVAPNPRTNREFTRMLARVLHRPLLLPPAPAFLLKLLLGEKSTIALDGQRVLAKRLKLTAFQFKYRELSEALNDIYRKDKR